MPTIEQIMEQADDYARTVSANDMGYSHGTYSPWASEDPQEQRDKLKAMIAEVVAMTARDAAGTNAGFSPVDIVQAHVAHCSGCETCRNWRKMLEGR